MTHLAKLTWIELKLFAREPFAIIFTFAFPLIVLLVLIGSFDPEDQEFGGDRPADYYLASYVGVVIGAVGLIAMPVHIASYRERGILRRFRASQVPAWQVLDAHLVVGLLMAALGSIVLTLAGKLIYDAKLPESPLATIVSFVIAAVCFLGLGLLIAAVTNTARSAQALGMLLFFPMWLLSGAGPPPSVMSDAMQTVSDLLPLTYVVRAIQDPWLGDGVSTGNLALLVAVLVVSLAASTWLLRES
jgi:ABC-2 type transport system permease protein